MSAVGYDNKECGLSGPSLGPDAGEQFGDGIELGRQKFVGV